MANRRSNSAVRLPIAHWPQILCTVSHSCGDTSWGCPATICRSRSSRLPPSTIAIAAATTAGDRLIPAPQWTKTGTWFLSKDTSVWIAAARTPSHSCAPSMIGKWQKVMVRGRLGDGSSTATLTTAVIPASNRRAGSRPSPALPSHSLPGMISRIRIVALPIARWFFNCTQRPKGALRRLRPMDASWQN